jgi:prophage regulatory protein
MSTSTESLLRLPELRARIGLGRSTIYRLVAAKQFPAPVKLSPQTIAWKASDVDAWIAARPRSGRVS